jgi:hypothetical protein
MLLMVLRVFALNAPAELIDFASSSTAVQMDDQSSDPTEDEVPPPLLLGVMMLALLVFVLLLAAGVVASVLALCLLLFLLACGIFTTSAIAGAVAKKPRTAVKAFFIQAGGVVGLPTGTGLALTAVWLFHLHVSRWSASITGAVIGAIAGVVFAMLFNLLWEKLLAILVAKGLRAQTPAHTTGDCS